MEPIFISSATQEDVTGKVNILHIQKLLEEMDLSAYCEQVQEINFIYIAVEDTTYHPESIEYAPEEQAINIHAQLDYAQIVEAEEEEILLLMKQLFVKQIKKFEKLEVAFDREAFEKDIRERFEFPEEEEE
jgi:phage FluMu protein Com